MRARPLPGAHALALALRRKRLHATGDDCDFIAEGPRDEEFIAKYAVMREEGETRAREAGEGGEVMNQAVKELKAAVTAELSCK